MCPKGEEGLGGPLVSFVLLFQHDIDTRTQASSAHSRTSALSTLTFRPPCEFRTSGLHTSPFFSSSSLPPPHLCPSRHLAPPQRRAGSQEGMLSIWPEPRPALWVHIRAPANVQGPWGQPPCDWLESPGIQPSQHPGPRDPKSQL